MLRLQRKALSLQSNTYSHTLSRINAQIRARCKKVTITFANAQHGKVLRTIIYFILHTFLRHRHTKK